MGEEFRVALDAFKGQDVKNAFSSVDDSRVNIGVGFLAWRLSHVHSGGKGGVKPTSSDEVLKTSIHSEAGSNSPVISLLDAALKPRPIAVWLSFGDADEMRVWTEVIRKRDAELNGQGDGLKVFIGIGSEQETKAAVEDCGADVLVAQGCEAGGHGLGSSPPLHAQLPRIAALLPTLKPGNSRGEVPPLLGAGGLSDGRSLASILALGADGGVLGTRLLLTPEAAYSDAQKQVLLKASSTETKRTMAFDEARGTLGWPEGVDGRGVINATVQAYESQEGDAESRRRRYKQAEGEGDEKRIVTWAGTGVGNMNVIKPAREVIQEVGNDALKTIEALSQTLKR
ncbi:NPD-domain-containing protein [Ceraceosorus guamensis]|uniref:NPD-domain-containing protein n=1 Tax=Ceraceosorus guamensis TaxID=1522189 RepID=A0A316VWW6_9BASI|nr:NPD-domain-containing protein [Ceraceosorus guamensis]PWN41970.1 NPD-domain-containing protein [Ceraceosorus guamensis]